ERWYKTRGEHRPGFSPWDCDDPYKLLTLHAYTPESPLCAKYSFAKAAAVCQRFKTFVDSKNPTDSKDSDDLWGIWCDPLLRHVDRLYLDSVLGSVRAPDIMATHTLVSIPL